MYPELRGHGHFIAEGARLIGDIHLEAESSIWFNVVLRADNAPIRIGRGSNIQDGSIVHTDPGYPVIVGDYVTVGHKTILHGCTIDHHALVGMGATLMNGVHVGPYCLIAAGSLLLEGFEAPEGTLVMGSPARVRRDLSPEERIHLELSAQNYMSRAQQYLTHLESL